MSPIRIFLLSLLASLGSAQGQIFADFTLSTGSGDSESPLGSFRVLLEHERAPRPVANFIGLATGERPWLDPVSGAIRNDRYYDGQIFHRLIHNFVIQGGDILGTGVGGPGFVIQDQFDGDLRHSGRYILSMAKGSLPNSNGSQFFITLAPTPNLDDRHSVFGEVISGREIIDGFTNAALFPTNGNDRPLTNINLVSVVISGPDLAGFDLFDPAHRLPILRPQEIAAEVQETAQGNQLSVRLPAREPDTLYRVSGGESLASLSDFGGVFSADQELDFAIPFAPTQSSSLFGRLVAVDYSLLRNPAPNLLAAEQQFVMTDRLGNELTMRFESASAGEWTHSDGGSGRFAITNAQDGLPNTGAISLIPNNADRIPLASFVAEFDGPVGPAGWLALNLVLSFHDETSGFVDGTAGIAGAVAGGPQQSVTILQAFTYSG